MNEPTDVVRTAFMVIGPPRSGTSAVCHVLNKLGLDFGDPGNFIDPENNRHNPVFFELADLNRLNDEILAALGWSFGEFNALPLQLDFDSSLADRFEARIEEFLGENFPGRAVFGLKDPRFCFTLPLWTLVLRRLGVRTRHLLIVRHPAAIAASNYRLTPERGMQHSRRIQPMSEGAARCFLQDLDFETVRFEELAANEPPVREVIARLLGASDGDVRAAIGAVFNRGLVHWQQETLPAPDAGAAGQSVDPTALGAQYRHLAQLARSFELLQPPAERVALAEEGRSVPTIPLGPASPWLSTRSDGGLAQIFYRKSESSYSEERSRTAPWPAHTNDAVFEIDFDAEVEANYVRVDFDDHPGAFFLRALSIDGVEIASTAALTCGSGVVLVRETAGWVGLITNHSDPWIELVLEAGSVRRVRVELTRMSLPEVTRCLAQAQSVDEKLDLLQARLSTLDDRWTRNSSHLQDNLDVHVADLHQQLTRVDQAVGGKLTDELEKLETRLGQEQKTSLAALSDVQSQGAQALSILLGMRAEQERRLGTRLRAWLGLDTKGDPFK